MSDRFYCQNFGFSNFIIKRNIENKYEELDEELDAEKY